VGPLDEPRSRWILEGVVAGVSGYGNAVGVPTVGGEVVADATYAENPLVNVLCLGLLPVERLVLGRASGVGNVAVLLGSTTGRDGIGGASVLASAGFGGGDDAEEAAKRPSVQVGDPFEEKRLIEACLTLLDAGLVVGIQDLGAAGLTGATSETTSRGGVGMEVDVAAVPRREPGMTPPEVMTSESQERMLAIVRPEDLDEVLAVCRRWEVRATPIGRVTDGDRLRIVDGPGGEVLADVPAASLAEDGPRYERPLTPPPPVPAVPAGAASDDPGADLLRLLLGTAWVWTQYDWQLFLSTVEGPGGDAAVLRLKHPTTGVDTGRALAVTVDGNQRWCAVDAAAGTALTVAEGVLNLACAGARPVAVVDCLNLGNPEHPEVMHQLAGVVDGMAEACRALGVPVIGGNVSLYNESRGRDIDPTPVVGTLGVVDRLDRRPPGVAVADGDHVLLVGPRSSELGGSRWAASTLGGGRPLGPLPALDLKVQSAVAGVIRSLVAGGEATGVHDVADGGLAVALGELVARSGVGLRVAGVDGAGELFSEAPSRVVVAAPAAVVPEVERRCRDAGVAVADLGTAGGDRLVVDGLVDLAVADVVAAERDTLPAAMAP
jgi:phosphoribosylformylglycinamidine synthase subunit PurL